jgi:hypothetical protein
LNSISARFRYLAGAKLASTILWGKNMSPYNSTLWPTNLDWLWPIVIASLILRFVIAFAIANSASKKNRSFSSFFWLTMIFDWTIMALIVAIIPFNEKDPRRPTNSWEIVINDED